MDELNTSGFQKVDCTYIRDNFTIPEKQTTSELISDIEDIIDGKYYNSYCAIDEQGQSIFIKAGDHTGTTTHELSYEIIDGKLSYTGYDKGLWQNIEEADDFMCHWFDYDVNDGSETGFTKKRCDHYDNKNNYINSTIDTDMDDFDDTGAPEYEYDKDGRFYTDEAPKVLYKDGGA